MNKRVQFQSFDDQESSQAFQTLQNDQYQLKEVVAKVQRPILKNKINGAQNERKQICEKKQQQPNEANLFAEALKLVIEDAELSIYQKQFFLENFFLQQKQKKYFQEKTFEATLHQINLCTEEEKKNFLIYYAKESRSHQKLMDYLEAYEKNCNPDSRKFVNRNKNKIDNYKYGTLAALEIEMKDQKFYKRIMHKHTKEKIQIFLNTQDVYDFFIDRKARFIFQQINLSKQKQECVFVEDANHIEERKAFSLENKEVQTDYLFKYQEILEMILSNIQSLELLNQKQKVVQMLGDFCKIHQQKIEALPLQHKKTFDNTIINFLSELINRDDDVLVEEAIKDLQKVDQFLKQF